MAVYDKPTISPDARRRARAPLALLAGVYVLSFALPMPSTDGKILELPTICPFNHLTGLPCPGCGLTRAFVSMAHGHLVEAVRWHALGPIMFVLGLVWLVECAVRVFAGRSLVDLDALSRSKAGWAVGAVFIAFGVARAVFYAVHHMRF